MPTAFETAVRMLEGRSKSRARLEAALLAKGHDAAAVEEALDRVTELGYLNDARHAEAKARAGLAEGRSVEDVQRRLEAEGVEAATAASAVKAAAEEAGYDARAAAQALVRNKRLSGVKAARFLASRGFDEDVIAHVTGGRAPAD